MTPKERVNNEVDDLESKTNKLVDFMVSSQFIKLSKEAQFLLEMQLDAMALYLDVLKRRLEIWQD